MALPDKDRRALERILGHDFADPRLLEQALTHASMEPSRRAASYERLEFLGDRVLALVVAELLLERFPDAPEGRVAPRHALLVSGRVLAGVGRTISLPRFIRSGPSGRGEPPGSRDSVVADCCEAIIGALHRDGGLDAARAFVRRRWDGMIEDVEPRVAKTALQEWALKRGLPPPDYVVTNRSGPDHEPVFTVEVTVAGRPAAAGTGPSRRAAEREAAETMLGRIGVP